MIRESHGNDEASSPLISFLGLRKRKISAMMLLLGILGILSLLFSESTSFQPLIEPVSGRRRTSRLSPRLFGWVQRKDGEWEWEEDDPDYTAPDTTITTTTTTAVSLAEASATPRLPAGKYRPKQSLGQNYLKDPNTVAKILRAFHADATRDNDHIESIIELGPGAGALTDKLVETYGTDVLQCIEIDERSIEILADKHPDLRVRHDDVLQVNYPALAEEEGRPLTVIGNLPYYITSQILFALADASH
jgi:hypothetical protein